MFYALHVIIMIIAFLFQQFIMQDVVIDCSSYNVTTLIVRNKQKKKRDIKYTNVHKKKFLLT